jgi:hypothetical protein
VEYSIPRFSSTVSGEEDSDYRAQSMNDYDGARKESYRTPAERAKTIFNLQPAKQLSDDAVGVIPDTRSELPKTGKLKITAPYEGRISMNDPNEIFHKQAGRNSNGCLGTDPDHMSLQTFKRKAKAMEKYQRDPRRRMTWDPPSRIKLEPPIPVNDNDGAI